MATIDQIKARVDLHDLAEKLGLDRPQGAGNYRSPHHDDTSPSLSIYDGGRRWKDHSVDGAGGDCIDLVSYVRGCKNGEAIRFLRELYGWNHDRQPREPRTSKQGTSTERERRKAKSGRDTAQEPERSTARQKALAQWERASPAPGNYPYLKLKQIPPSGARVNRNELLVPLMDVAGEIHSLQRISPDGSTKKFFKGCATTGFFYPIGALTDRVYVCEGFATGASIHAATLNRVFVAFNVGNLGSVANEVRRAFPNHQVIIAADNDIRKPGNPGVTHARSAAKAIQGLLATPEFPEEAGDCSDFNDLHQIDGLEAVRKQLEDAAPPDGRSIQRYKFTDEGTWEPASSRREERLLANFQALIAEQVVHDDGEQQSRGVILKVRHAGQDLPRITVSADEFEAMKWPLRYFGTALMLHPGQTIKESLRHAIQLLSLYGRQVRTRTIYTHTGWTKLPSGWAYLSAGGAIGAEGKLDDVDVDLSEQSRYRLPPPSRDASERRAAARASREMFDSLPDHVGVTLAGITFLAPFASHLNPDLLVLLEGPSRSGKSTLAALACAHFGGEISRTSLAANWTDTANALEHTLFELKDALAIIDDYAPQPSTVAQGKLDEIMTRIARSLGNRSSRGRMTRDLARRRSYLPRCVVLSTAEQFPPGESINARLFGLSLDSSTLDWTRISKGQSAAVSELLSRCMADYVRTIARDYEDRCRQAADRWRTLRAQASDSGLSGRLPEQVAYLLFGYESALLHWRDSGALTATAEKMMAGEAWDQILELARQSERRITFGQPAEAFRLALLDLLESGAVHVKDKVSDIPLSRKFGWRNDLPSGTHIGFVDRPANELLLFPVVTRQAVNEALRKSGEPVTLNRAAIDRQLRQKGYMKGGDIEEREAGTVKRTSKLRRLDGKPQRTLTFDLGRLGLLSD